jgi:uncharacterized membrane protein YqjE
MNESSGRFSAILETFEHLGATVASSMEARVQKVRAGVRAEVRRAASALGLAIVAAAFTFAALAFGAVAILIAAWDTQPVLAAALIALGFAIFAVSAVLMARSCTR